MDELTTTELISKITDTKKLKFLELYPKCNNMISETAIAMGLNRHTVFGWLREDDMLSTAFTSLKKDMEQAQEEYYVNRINSIIDDDKTPPQTRLLGSFFMLKSLNPRYRDNQQQGNIFTGDIIVQSSIPRPIEGDYKELEDKDATE